MLGGQPTGRGRIYKDMMDNKQHSTKLGGGHEPLKNGHPCKTFTSVSTMFMSTMSGGKKKMELKNVTMETVDNQTSEYM